MAAEVVWLDSPAPERGPHGATTPTCWCGTGGCGSSTTAPRSTATTATRCCATRGRGPSRRSPSTCCCRAPGRSRRPGRGWPRGSTTTRSRAPWARSPTLAGGHARRRRAGRAAGGVRGAPAPAPRPARRAGGGGRGCPPRVAPSSTRSCAPCPTRSAGSASTWASCCSPARGTSWGCGPGSTATGSRALAPGDRPGADRRAPRGAGADRGGRPGRRADRPDARPRAVPLARGAREHRGAAVGRPHRAVRRPGRPRWRACTGDWWTHVH